MLEIQKSRKIYANIMALVASVVNQQPGYFLPSFQISRFNTVSKINAKLGNNFIPITVAATPLLGNIYGRQIEQLKQRIIRRENRPALRNFPQLAIEIFNLVRRINHLPHFQGVFEISG